MKLALGLPAYRPLDPRVAMSHRRFAQALTRAGIEWDEVSVMQQAFLGSALTSITHHFLSSQCDRLLILDDDVVFNPLDAVKLVKSELDCVAGDYPLKTPTGERLAQPDPDLPRMGDFQPCLFVGLGYCSFSRKCIEAVAEISTPYLIDERYADGGQLARATFFPQLTDGRRLEDDVAFFMKVRAAGFTPYLDTKCPAGHVGTCVYMPRSNT